MSATPPTEAANPGTATLAQQLAASSDPATAAQCYRSAITALVQWQLQNGATQPPPQEARDLATGMESFVTDYIVGQRGLGIDAAQRKILDAAFAAIAAEYLALPQIAIHGHFTLDDLLVDAQSSAAIPTSFSLLAPIGQPAAAKIGPVGYDIVSLVRDPLRPWDEDFSLDITIRYWDMARKAGLPVGADFGEFYRGMEWTALLRHLSEPAPRTTPHLHAWVSFLHSACARYRELRPLSRLIEEVQGIEATSGYAFGRV